MTQPGTVVDAYVDDLAAFVEASPSSYHAAHEVARRLVDAGFARLAETDAWPTAPGRYLALRDGAAIAWVIPDGARATTPVRIVGAHTDSPGFKLKPHPTTEAHGWLQAGVEVYGGPLLNSWLDRELELAGRLVLRDGTERLVRTGPYLRIPQLAVHLDRSVNDGLVLDRQRHTQPVFGVLGDDDLDAADLLGQVAAAGGVEPGEFAGYDLVTCDTQRPARFGRRRELFASPRLDNLSSVHAGLTALIATAEHARAIAVLAAFDHEELGSESRSGASGSFLEDVLVRVYEGLGAAASDRLRAFAASWLVSADAGHAVHPNYPERHDPANRPVAGGGPLLKINANQRYATDAAGAALWARLAEQAGIEYQEFVSNNAIPCGSTIGPLAATRLGIATVDVGIPLLSMHSARELCHVADPVSLAAALAAFFAL